MKFEKFILNHWDVFLRHICEYYPLDKDFLEKYEYELAWNSISKNRQIKWNQKILERFENRFLWHELAWNEAINWETPLIQRFKKRLDWYYLGRNKNLPITSEFIIEHKKKIFIIESNIHLTPELKKEYGKDLLPSLKNNADSLSEEQLNNLEDTLLSQSGLTRDSFHNLYENYISRYLSEKSLEQIFEEKFDYSQRYFKINPIENDIHGLTPEFQIDGKNVFEEFREGRGLFEITSELQLVNGSLQEGPPRLYELPRFSGMSYYPILLVSENLKSVFESFKISNHKFIPVKIQPKKIKTDLIYYILQIEYDSFLKRADFHKLQFQKLTKNDWFGEFKKELLSTGEIRDYDSIASYTEDLKAQDVKYSKLVPINYISNTDRDIFTIEGDVIVNEYVKKAIEDSLPNQVQFDSVQLLNISIPQPEYDSKSFERRNTATVIDSEPSLDEELVFYYQKAKRIVQEEKEIGGFINNDEFLDIQQKFNVLIPESFKQRYRNNEIDSEEFEFLPIQEFYIQNEYADRVPETYKSLIVAENGCGDSLGLILEKEDDFKLRENLYEYNHETGEVEEY
jgi:hypothetical protein